MYCNLGDGRKIAMPRYYKLKIYTDEERKQISEFMVPKLLIDADKKYFEEIEYHGSHEKRKKAKYQEILADRQKLKTMEKQRAKI